MRLLAISTLLIGLLLISSPARAQDAPAPVRRDDLRSDDAAVRAKALAALDAQLKADPRRAGRDIERNRLLDAAMSAGEYEAVAELSLRCINSQADRIFQLEYFFPRRIAALRALDRNVEALAAAKSHYNIAKMVSTAKAIDLLAECLDAAYPNDPSKAKRFKLQQFAGAAAQPSSADPSLGSAVLAEIIVDPSIYTDDAIDRERNRDWRELGKANLMLMRDKPANAKPMFETLARSGNASVREAAIESLARADKAIAGAVGPGNKTLELYSQAAQP